MTEKSQDHTDENVFRLTSIAFSGLPLCQRRSILGKLGKVLPTSHYEGYGRLGRKVVAGLSHAANP